MNVIFDRAKKPNIKTYIFGIKQTSEQIGSNFTVCFLSSNAALCFVAETCH